LAIQKKNRKHGTELRQEWALLHTNGHVHIKSWEEMVHLTTLYNISWCVEHPNTWNSLDDHHRVQQKREHVKFTPNTFNSRYSKGQILALISEFKLLWEYVKKEDKTQAFITFPKRYLCEWYNKTSKNLIFFCNPLVGFTVEQERNRLPREESKGFDAIITYQHMLKLSNTRADSLWLSTEMINFYLGW
jgi:hypothetical protein